MSERGFAMYFRERCAAQVDETLEDMRPRLEKLRRLGWRDEGQAAVELAFCLPVLLLLVTGLLTFGITLTNYITLTEATGVGGRQIAIQRGQTGDPCAIAASAIAAAAPLLKNTGNASTGIGMTFTVYTTATASTAYTAMPATCSNAALTQGMPVTVATTYPCLLKVFGANYVPTCTLKAQTTEVVQ
jgi:Flp pilus assembly protein TadG